MIIAGRCRKDTMAREQELSFYRNYLKTDDFTLEANEPEKFGSFIIALQSRIIIGSYSTLLREVICVNKKIFVCNYSGHSDLDFVENRHDQSVFSILCKKNDIKSLSAYECDWAIYQNKRIWDHTKHSPILAKRDLQYNTFKRFIDRQKKNFRRIKSKFND